MTQRGQGHEGHDHAGHAHEHHEHHGHEHHGHAHEHHDHEHHGHAHEHHEHHGHAHEHHDHEHHGHAHAAPAAAAARTRAAETGGQACQLDLSVVLPGETDDQGRFQKLEELLEAHQGISDVHLRRDGQGAEVCVHYDHDRVSLPQVEALLRATGVKVAERYLHKTWFVRGMDCAQCGFVIEHALARLPGVLTASVAYAAERLVVEYDRERVKPAAIEKRVHALGFELDEPQKGHACSSHAHGGGLSPSLELPLALTSGALVAAGFALAHLAHVPALLVTLLYAAAALAGGVFAGRAAFNSVRQLSFDIETLMVLAAIGALVLGAWFEGALLLALFSIGHALEHRASERTRRAIEALGKLRPEVARVKRDGALVEVPVAQVAKGDRIVVRPGDRVPLDGRVVDGRSSLDQAAITGESIPVAKAPGDDVFAGTINGEAALEIQVTKLASESALARVIDLVSEAEAQKSPTQRFTQKLERRFVPVVLALAPLLAAFHYFFVEASVKAALLRAMSLLVAASPCALAISTPSAVLSAVARAARGGVLVKGGAHLEALGKVATFAFDKTGTLTVGKPALVALVPVAGVSEAALLAAAAGAESLSQHPLALAVLAGAKQRGVTAGQASSFEAVHGKGLRALVDGRSVVVGNPAMFEGAAGLDALRGELERLESAGQTTMIVQEDGRFLGVIGVADTLRPEARQTLAELRALGVSRTLLLSGDNTRVARAIGTQVGVDEARGPLMPEGKVAALKELAGTGGVAMVGDGVNDAPALAAASVGVSMGGAGSDVALETADVVLMSDDLRRLPFAVGLARQATRVIRQNLVVSLGVSVVLVAATLFGWVAIAQAVVFHEGSTLLVVGNAFRLLAYRE